VPSIEDKKVKVLIIDDEEDIVAILKKVLELKSYDVISAADGVEGIQKAKTEEPDIILLDVMIPKIDGYEVCKRLRSDRFTGLVPIIMLTAKGESYDKILGLERGADDYLTKPFDLAELEARIKGVLHHARHREAVNPLTRLPGNISIEEEIKRRLKEKKIFAVAYFDLDNFKAYNDRYGYERGDAIIQFVASIIKKVITELGLPDDFIGHIGGDDFIIVSTPDRIGKVCQSVIEEFDKTIPLHYSEADRKQGFITSKDRLGRRQKFPIMTLTTVAVSNERHRITHYAQISERAIELKRYAKKIKGSCFVMDRRGLMKGSDLKEKRFGKRVLRE
jgi:diguanylate cyclase (GGDEF)-like protein